ncbi:MAG: DsbA family protein [Alphaproteobacteria bacterium]|mgnify:CR=1 FL=1
MADRVIGKPEAPVTIIEYASLTCPHCAAFHRDTLPKLKSQYIETGKIKLIFRDFPLDSRATVAAMVARCAPRDRYFSFVDALFRGQDQWARSDDPMKALAQIARLGGMTEADFEACTKNEALFQAVRKERADAESQFGVNATPSFIINGKKADNVFSFESFEKALKPLVK